MSTMEASGAADVLADLDELDSVMGVETQDQQDLKPKQVCVCVLYLNAILAGIWHGTPYCPLAMLLHGPATRTAV